MLSNHVKTVGDGVFDRERGFPLVLNLHSRHHAWEFMHKIFSATRSMVELMALYFHRSLSTLFIFRKRVQISPISSRFGS